MGNYEQVYSSISGKCGDSLGDKKWCVYEHLFPNGKRYIGITSKVPKNRWENGNGYTKEKQPVMYNAIQKYGWDNIEHNVLFKGLSMEEACEKEKELISLYKTNCVRYGDDYGYNMTDGGEGKSGGFVSEKSRELSRDRLLGKKGKDCPNSRIVVCDGVEYESLTQFKELNGYPKGNISGWLNGVVGMPKKWYDKKLHYKDLGFDIVTKYKSSENRNRRVVADGIVFNSMCDCAKHLEENTSTISLVLNNKVSPNDKILNSGLRYEDEDSHEYKERSKYFTKELKCSIDDIVFNNLKSLADYIGEEKGTVWAWLRGKNKVPEKYLNRGMKIIE